MQQNVIARNRFFVIPMMLLLAAVGLVVGGTESASLPPLRTQLQPEGQYAYVGNNGSQDVSIYQVNQNGGLQPVGTVPAGGGPQGVAVNSNMNPSPFAITAQSVYVVNEDSGTISVYQINPGTGQLTPMGDPVPTGGNPQAIAVDPNGHMAIVANMDSNNVSVYSINQNNGGLSPMQTVPTGGQDPVAVAVSPSGTMAFVANQGSNNVSVYSMNPDNGMLTPVGNPVPLPSGGAAPSSVAVLPTENLVVTTNPTTNNLSLFAIPPNPSPFLPLIPIGSTAPPMGSNPSSVDISPNGDVAVTLMSGGNGKQNNGLVALFRISRVGTVSLRGFAVTDGGPTSVALDPGGIVHVTNRERNTISSFATVPGNFMPLGTQPTGQSPEKVALAF